METSWESELAALLTELLATQDEVLKILARKRELLRTADTDGLMALGPEEEKLVGRLQQCMKRRGELLDRARREGLPSTSIRALTQALPRSQRGALDRQVRLAGSRGRLLQHHSLTNWVVIQRTLLHLSQLLEIIATGGRLQPTYGEGEPVRASGSLVDRAA
ncbi:MAG TPA: flagellar export chaperone FlgN [Thermoguttaceae bacterium]|nr:flagellar export chaperone FlgN [Thermoguttaceae bacterium]